MILFYRKYNYNILNLISQAIKERNNSANPKKKKKKKIKKLKKNKNKNKKEKINIQLGDTKIMINQEISLRQFKDNNNIQETISDNNKKLKLNNNSYNLNDEEINTLDFKNALIIDKRSFFQYYLSLIKKKNIIIFSFFPINDYNLMYMKIGFFLISFGLYFTVNGLFFTDKTMHKIYKDRGIYNFIFQLLSIIYSTIISSIISFIFKRLSLSEPNIISLKTICKK